MSPSQDKVFQRRKEDFICEQCGVSVSGDGYTNHCPKCLYSKHVDTSPGDRVAECGGLMVPVQFEQVGAEYRLTHRCVRCGHEKKNKTSVNDDFDALLVLARRLAEQ